LRRNLLRLASAVILPVAAAALPPGAEPESSFAAARAIGPIQADGRLDEPAWSRAQPYSRFIQSFPDEGAPATQRTEVRVLFDEARLYLGIHCFDTSSGAIVRPLGRRDSPPSSDQVVIVVDPGLDHRSANMFVVTAGGVLADGLYYDDDQSTYDWDAVWEGAVSVHGDGWTAELAIPLSTFRFKNGKEQVWGLGVQRIVGRSHEKAATVLLPRNGRGIVSRLGHLTGLEGIQPGLDLEITPYLAGRLSLRPRHADADFPRPRMLAPQADVGVDLNLRLGSRLTLTGAINPDFGQVEADQIVLNLSSFEQFFPEKRPFFNQGLDLFQPVGAGFEDRVPQQLFYSRRIGLDAPILGAAKVVGHLADGVRIGLLDALTSGTGMSGAASAATPEAAEDAPGRGTMRWSWAQPFRLAPDGAYPLVRPPTVNDLAAVLRVEAAERLVLGLAGTSRMAIGERCRLSDDELDELPDNRRPGVCDMRGGQALALDGNATSPGGEWYGYGQVAGSQVADGPTERTLADGTILRHGDTGLGGYLRAGKRGGEPWRFELAWAYASPRFNLNPSGFQRTQNEQEWKATLRYARPSGGGPFHEWSVWGSAFQHLTTDGRGLQRGRQAFVQADGRLRDPYLWLEVRLSWDDPQYDVREIGGTGIPLRRPGWTTLGFYGASDDTRMVFLESWIGVMKNEPFRPAGAPWALGFYLGGALRPHPRVETRMSLNYEPGAYALRYLADVEPVNGTYYFAALQAPSLSLVLRQLVVLTPRVTFQLYGQLFTAGGRYGPYWSAARQASGAAPPDLRPIHPTDLTAVTGDLPFGSQDFHETQLVVNAVLRWEYRLGSTLYLVYARNQAELPFGAGPDVPASDRGPPTSLRPRSLGRGPTTDTLLVKWSWWFGP